MFVLLGDSILKNDAYVSDGKSVGELVKERTNGKSLCLAADNSKIVDVYEQVGHISGDLNNNTTTIFLSAGGNDILTHYVDKENDSAETSILKTMFASYKKLIENIRSRLPKTNIVLLDIYYPENMKYKQYHSIIKEWNNMLYAYAEKNNYSVLKVSNILTKSEDFSFGIEPSSIGSKKLVEVILTNSTFVD
jgi:lysophospholipase L1-like esterase